MGQHNYKLIAVDLDGTLLNEESQISEETAYWLGRAQEAGFHVCFATGRGQKSSYPFMQQLNLPGPFVFVNGSEIWLTKDQLHLRHTMPVEDVLTLREMAIAEGIWYWAYCTDGVYNINNWHPNPHATEWLKFGFNSYDLGILARLNAKAEQMGRFEITNSDVDNLELNPKGISKATGLQEVCKLLGITMDQIVAFGDSRNDLKMIQAAGLGVAMGNAQDVVKQAADHVTLTNVEHGIAAFIQKHLL
jgi:HAD superfamily hydrolase (TIGR01484 family)